jgi:hypothetical protein
MNSTIKWNSVAYGSQTRLRSRPAWTGTNRSVVYNLLTKSFQHFTSRVQETFPNRKSSGSHSHIVAYWTLCLTPPCVRCPNRSPTVFVVNDQVPIGLHSTDVPISPPPPRRLACPNRLIVQIHDQVPVPLHHQFCVTLIVPLLQRLTHFQAFSVIQYIRPSPILFYALLVMCPDEDQSCNDYDDYDDSGECPLCYDLLHLHSH